MKRLIILTFAAFLASGSVMAQQPQQRPEAPKARPQHVMHHGNPGGGHCGNCPHHRGPQVNADGIDMAIVKAFPAVKKIMKTEKWTEVYDQQGKLLGYVVYSKPASDGIKGYNGETPVLIALNAMKVITGVYPLPNAETPRFAQHVQESGFYDNWNGLTIKKAKKKKVDTVSGATYTSRAVVQSVQAALEKL